MKTLFKPLCKVLLFAIVTAAADPSWSAGKVAVDVELNPVGSFTAKAETVQGFAQRKMYKGAEVLEARNVTFKIDDLQTGVDLRDKHMKEKYFESQKFPMAIMKVARGQNGKFKGQLNVHHVDKIVAGTYTVKGSELIAKFKAKMSSFKIKNASYMGVGATDEVNVEVSIPVK